MGACAIEHRAADTDLAVASARASCTEAFDTASQENIQVHGGIGFTWEHDCHLYYRRARTLALALGPLPLWKDRIVSALERRLAD
jgi:alkylation response protein AidB-like acyl-CoA dehydrogenase